MCAKVQIKLMSSWVEGGKEVITIKSALKKYKRILAATSVMANALCMASKGNFLQKNSGPTTTCIIYNAAQKH